jgi:hypothetical protein
MPQFILDLQWTSQGLSHVPSGEYLAVRAEAISFAEENNLSFFPPKIIDRLVPTTVGPIWFVEGKEEDVKNVVARFNGFGNVTAQYFDYITEEDKLKDLIAKLFAVPTRSRP